MDTNIKGLSSSEASQILTQHGPNKLPEKPLPSSLKIFLYQLKSPLVYVLLVAGVVTFFLGETADTTIIAIAVFINTILGFVQERRASKSINALKQLIHPHATVIRDGELKSIKAEEIVPGDTVVLSEGVKIPADGKILTANRFFVSEAILTGESVPVTKDKDGEVFMGTIVTAGKAMMVVEKTGGSTQIGAIAISVQETEEDTPLKRQLAIFSRQLSVMVLVLIAIVFVIGVYSGLPAEEIFTTSVALAVSSIPEGLLVALTVVLAIGMQRIVKRKGLVRRLVSAETLGGVTTICLDKTGTLTEGKMRVVDVSASSEQDVARQLVVANDLDNPMLIAAWEWASKKLRNPERYRENYKRLDSIPFNSQQKFFASLHRNQKDNLIFVNGAPDILLEWCKLTKIQKQNIHKDIEKYTSDGKRVLGFATKKVKTNKVALKHTDVKGDLEWVGLVAFDDPVRTGIQDAFEKTRSAGISLLVITGDYTQIAMAVMRGVGFEVTEDDVLVGSELDHMTEEQLSNKLKSGKIKLFARTTPDQKLKIVSALQKNGEVVAMMGDGVNDAPALKKADIGIVVGEATDVAKETADLVLLDSNFETIIAAIEEGRGIFDNIRKVILYLMSDAFEEIIAVIGTLILALPLPVTAAQILWINLISDGFPNLALTIDPKNENIMNRPPRSPKEKIVAGWMKELIATVSIVGGLMALGIFVHYYNKTGDLVSARSVAFATLGVNSLIYVYSVRTLHEPFWRENLFNNKWLQVSVLGGMLMQFVPFSTPFFRNLFDLRPLNIYELGFIFGASIVMFLVIEVTKEVTNYIR